MNGGKINDGGPAFPCEQVTPLGGGAARTHRDGGMSLRDYFAAKAMQAMVTVEFEAWSVESRCANWAEHAYKMADEMLKAREAGQ